MQAKNLRGIDPPSCDNCKHIRRVRVIDRKCVLDGGYDGRRESVNEHICDLWQAEEFWSSGYSDNVDKLFRGE